MNNREINHAKGLIDALKRRAQMLRDTADDLDQAKEGRSRMAANYRKQAQQCDDAIANLKAAIDGAVWFREEK